MDEKMLEEARKLGVRLFNGIAGNKREICNYLYDKYGMSLSYGKAYADIWEQQVLSYYGLEIMVRISLTEMRRRLPDDDYYSLKRAFEQGRTPSYDEWDKMSWDWRYVLLDGDSRDYSVKWQDYAKFFFEYCEAITSPTKKEVMERHAQRMKELYGITVPEEEMEEIKEERLPTPSEAKPSAVERETLEKVKAEAIGALDLEHLYEELLKRKGYKTERNVHIAGPYGGEVDILATTKDEVILVECKHWKTQTGPVAIDELHVFRSKVIDASPMFKSKKVSPTFVSASGFTSEARTFALANGIETIEGLDLAKEFIEWGIIGVTIEGRDYFVIGPRTGKDAARYNKNTGKIEII